MIYESQKMRLECVRIVKKSDINDILICQDLNTEAGSMYTVIAVKDHRTARKFLEIFQNAGVSAEDSYVDCFSERGQFIMVFPYKQERPLNRFYMGDTLSLTQCEDICINVILSCISSALPYPILYLVLQQNRLNLSRDMTIYLGYEIDLTELDETRTERDCVVCAAEILRTLLQPKASQKAVSYQLLQKKIGKRSYSKFTELYKDIRIAAAPKKKTGIKAMLGGWWLRNKDTIFHILLWVCGILAVFMLVSFVTQLILGDIPWLRVFFNGFKTIGTESLLQ